MTPQFHPSLVNGPFDDPAVYVDFLFERRALLFDLGDIRALPPRKILRLTHIFISHTHIDHFIGFDHLLRLCLGREKRLHLFGPPGFIAQVEHRLASYTWNLVESYDTDFTLVATELHPDNRSLAAEFHCCRRFRREN
jgi:ribonuclease Z